MRGREGEREGEKHQCVVVSHAPPTGDLDRNQGVCPDWEFNWQPFGLQASAQSTDPHQPGLYLFKLMFSISSDKYPEVGLLDHMVVLFLIFRGPSTLFSIVAVPVSIPTDSA